MEGVLGGSGDGPGPAGRGVPGGRPLAAGTGGNPTPGIQGTLLAALRQVPSHERAEVCTEADEQGLVVGADRKASADPGAVRAGNDERLGDQAESRGHRDSPVAGSCPTP